MFRTGHKVGPYTLVQELGSGTFGSVWLANRQGKLADTEVALKLPKVSTTDWTDIQKEAKNWVRAMGHPNVLQLFEAEEYNGHPVIVTEYARDGSLAKWLKDRGSLPVTAERATEIVSDILRGLAHIHANGVIHRDLKPSNVMLKAGTPLIADFGLARGLHEPSATLRVGGSPPYMAPEVWSSGERCVEADLWAVGVILYELLAGSRPFDGPNQARLTDAICFRAHPPLPAALPGWLRDVVARSLQKNKEQRYRSADEMLTDLGRGYAVPAVGNPVPAACGTGTLLGVAVDLSGSMEATIQNRNARVTRFEAFRQSLGRLVDDGASRLTAGRAADRFDVFVYGFGLRLVPHADLLALLRTAESPQLREQARKIQDRLTAQAQRSAGAYRDLGLLAERWGLGGVVRAATEAVTSQVREQVFGELRPLVTSELAKAGDVTLGLSELADQWRSSGGTFEEVRPALFGDTPMCGALGAIAARFRRELGSRAGAAPVLFLLSDGAATDGDPVPRGDEFRALGVTVVSCFVGGQDVANPRVLYGIEQTGWDEGAKHMFRLASPLDPRSGFADYLLRHGWGLQPGARLFVQVNHSEVLEEFMRVVMTPLGTTGTSLLGEAGR